METQGRAGSTGSEMWGVLLVPSSSPTLSPIYDGLDVNVTSTVTWFTATMTWFHVESINYPSTEGTPLQYSFFRAACWYLYTMWVRFFLLGGVLFFSTIMISVGIFTLGGEL